jgi:hypothetical protein
MGSYTRTYSFTNGTIAYGDQLVTELDALGSSVNNIVNAQISSGAAIVDSKLAKITTANKVSLTAVEGIGAVGGVLGNFQNLKVVRTSATQVTVTADELVLEDSSNNKAHIRTVSQVAAITTSGAGGLDTGSEASATWYFVWIIRKSSDGTTSSLLSTSSSSPTMPSGYDQKALVSAVRNDGSSNFVDFTQEGNQYCYTATQSVYSGAGGAAWQVIDVSAVVPSALSTVAFGNYLQYGSITSYAGVNNNNTDTVPSSISTGNQYSCYTSDRVWAYWKLRIITANTLYYYTNGSGNGAMQVSGFEINKLS